MSEKNPQAVRGLGHRQHRWPASGNPRRPPPSVCREILKASTSAALARSPAATITIRPGHATGIGMKNTSLPTDQWNPRQPPSPRCQASTSAWSPCLRGRPPFELEEVALSHDKHLHRLGGARSLSTAELNRASSRDSKQRRRMKWGHPCKRRKRFSAPRRIPRHPRDDLHDRPLPRGDKRAEERPCARTTQPTGTPTLESWTSCEIAAHKRSLQSPGPDGTQLKTPHPLEM